MSSGVGVTVRQLPSGQHMIVELVPGSASANSPIEPGELVLAVNGADCTSCTTDELADKILGPEGSVILLQTLTQDGLSRSVNLERGNPVRTEASNPLQSAPVYRPDNSPNRKNDLQVSANTQQPHGVQSQHMQANLLRAQNQPGVYEYALPPQQQPPGPTHFMQPVQTYPVQTTQPVSQMMPADRALPASGQQHHQMYPASDLHQQYPAAQAHVFNQGPPPQSLPHPATDLQQQYPGAQTPMFNQGTPQQSLPHPAAQLEQLKNATPAQLPTNPSMPPPQQPVYAIIAAYPPSAYSSNASGQPAHHAGHPTHTQQWGQASQLQAQQVHQQTQQQQLAMAPTQMHMSPQGLAGKSYPMPPQSAPSTQFPQQGDGQNSNSVPYQASSTTMPLPTQLEQSPAATPDQLQYLSSMQPSQVASPQLQAPAAPVQSFPPAQAPFGAPFQGPQIPSSPGFGGGSTFPGQLASVTHV